MRRAFAFVALLCGCMPAAAEAAVSSSDDQQIESGATSQGGGSVTSSSFRQQLSISDPVAGVRLSSARFRLIPGILGSSLSALAAAPPEAELRIETLYAMTETLGARITPHAWQRDRDPVFVWEPPETGAEVAGYSYAIDGVPDEIVDTAATSFNVASSALRALADGTHTFMVQAINSAGAAGAPASIELWIDTLAPSIIGYAPSPGALLNAASSSVTATITDAHSGVAPETVLLLLNGRSLASRFDPATNTVSTFGVAWSEGANSLELRVADGAGNAPAPLVWSVTADTQPPSGRVLVNGGAERTTSIFVTLSLEASDATSGVSRILVSNAEDRGYVEEPFASIRDLWKLTAVRGAQSVYVKFVDQAGNVSAPVSDAIELALLSPETAILAGPAGVTKELQAAFEFSCPEGGCVFAYAFDDGDWSAWSAGTTALATGLAYGNHYFRVKAAKDVNGVAGIQPDEEDATPAERTWVVGLDAPFLAVPKGPPIKVWRLE